MTHLVEWSKTESYITCPSSSPSALLHDVGPASRLPREGGLVSNRILIVDDNDLMRRLVRSSIEHHSDWHVCGEAENGEVAVEKVKELLPDVVILDLQMPVMNGLEAARHIARLAPNAAVLMLTMFRSEYLLREAQAVGIKEVVSKSGNFVPLLLASLANACAGSW